MPNPRLIHIGSAVIDFIYQLERLPAPGDDLTASTFAALPGGGFNMMAAARRSGMHTVYGGKIGDGLCGAMLAAAFHAENIECLQPVTAGVDSGTCVVLITADGERTFISRPGAEGIIVTGDFQHVSPNPGDWVFTSGYTLAYPGSRDSQAQFISELPPEIVFAFDPTGIVFEIPGHILKLVLGRTDWLSCNRAEAAAIAGDGSDDELAQRLLSQYCPNANGIIIRSGAEGALLALRGSEPVVIPAFDVEAIDTNGAGDAHVGAFIAALSQGREPLDALRWANAAAAISTTRRGGSVAPASNEIIEFLMRAQDEKSASAEQREHKARR
jgi:sugar/nucleoside kinase (ribokinase family)